jgi:hypothetical protein
MIELDWISAGIQLDGRDRAGLALGWLDIIELEWISAGWTRSIRGWLLTGWTPLSQVGTRLAGDNRAGMDLSWLDAIDQGLVGNS